MRGAGPASDHGQAFGISSPESGPPIKNGRGRGRIGDARPAGLDMAGEPGRLAVRSFDQNIVPVYPSGGHHGGLRDLASADVVERCRYDGICRMAGFQPGCSDICDEAVGI